MSLITLSDFGEYKFLTANINAAKDLDPHIDEAEEFDLKPVLGEQLYLDFKTNVALPHYQTLLLGGQYTYKGNTYEFKGAKAVLVYYTYVRLLVNNGVTSTPSGFTKKILENSERPDNAQLSSMINQAKSGARHHENQMLLYLERMSNTYPLFKCSHQTNPGTVKINSIG